jgi:plastocyanin
MTKHLTRHAIVVGIALAASACGGSSSSGAMATPTSAGCNPSVPSTSTTITITNNTVCPQNITVPIGTQVTFVNQDTIAHEMFSNPHPEHTDCPDLDQVGHLEPGQGLQSGNLNIARVCGFHDHIHPDVATLKGNITIH